MNISKHAEKRCQMRGIPQDCQEIVVRHGTPIQRPGGATAFYMSEKNQRAAMDDCRKLLKTLERTKNTTIVVGEDGTCITAYKSAQHIKK